MTVHYWLLIPVVVSPRNMEAQELEPDIKNLTDDRAHINILQFIYFDHRYKLNYSLLMAIKL
jgi:hypothetical protein